MKEEQKVLLRMLSEGKITAEEAEQLLEALGKQVPPAEPKTRIPAGEATEEEPASPAQRAGYPIENRVKGCRENGAGPGENGPKAGKGAA